MCLQQNTVFWYPDPVQGGKSHGNEFILQNSCCFDNNFKLSPSFSSIRQIFWNPYMQYLESWFLYILEGIYMAYE